MSLVQLSVMYGHLEGTEGKFARDPSGYISIEAGRNVIAGSKAEARRFLWS
jgi:hypothetical protein